MAALWPLGSRWAEKHTGYHVEIVGFRPGPRCRGPVGAGVSGWVVALGDAG